MGRKETRVHETVRAEHVPAGRICAHGEAYKNGRHRRQGNAAGCGCRLRRGATIGYLRELHPGWEVSGIDADPAFCAAGMTETGRAESLPFPDGSIDVILMECSLSKTEQPERAAAEAFRVLKTGGWLLISDMYARRREILSDGGGMLGRLEGAHRIWKRDGGGVFCV